MHCDIDGRGLLEVLPLGVADFPGVTVDRCVVLRGEPDGGAEVVNVGMRQQDCLYVAGAIAQLPHRRQHLVALTRKAGVDEDQAAGAGDQGPVHQGRLGEVHVVGHLDETVGGGSHGRECMHRVPVDSGPHGAEE